MLWLISSSKDVAITLGKCFFTILRLWTHKPLVLKAILEIIFHLKLSRRKTGKIKGSLVELGPNPGFLTLGLLYGMEKKVCYRGNKKGRVCGCVCVCACAWGGVYKHECTREVTFTCLYS